MSYNQIWSKISMAPKFLWNSYRIPMLITITMNYKKYLVKSNSCSELISTHCALNKYIQFSHCPFKLLPTHFKICSYQMPKMSFFSTFIISTKVSHTKSLYILGIQVMRWAIFIKVPIFWEGHRIWKKISHLFF